MFLCVSPLIPSPIIVPLSVLSVVGASLMIISLYKPLYAHCMQVSNSKLNLTAQELTCLVACCVDCIELSAILFARSFFINLRIYNQKMLASSSPGHETNAPRILHYSASYNLVITITIPILPNIAIFQAT